MDITIINKVSFYVLRDLSSLKYIYDTNIHDSISSYCHKYQITLTDEEKQEVYNKVNLGLKNIFIYCLKNKHI